MKQVSSKIKLELAQYRELASFSARELYLMKRPEEIIFLIKDSVQDKQ